ncbi:mevalonate kinase [Nosema bombycis CQ1]|uniref:phosphomevalonate kinase n=1 Tax=Nosema bombycis (strain CQ1 / CVCC 102059) TaxID=578461 RepID=R0M7J4_NOSB1|nr:mevalonate kinase [Nosema bombycis CQ1]|eukprot:EOB13954.1 mevalonate kinase [Nosema bombycis CQ1]
MAKTLKIKIPGKVIINGSYIVLKGEKATCVTINRYLNVKSFCYESEKCDIVVNIKNKDSWSLSKGGESYIAKIINAFYKVTGLKITNQIIINMEFDDGFFITEKIKTGIGSSACILVGIFYTLLYFNKDQDNSCLLNNDLIISLLKKINRIISPKSSGADVMTCLLGSINYSFSVIEKISRLGKFLILGSFGKCTSTRDVLKQCNMEDKKWDRLIQLNYNILNTRSKHAYEEYLDELSLDTTIVPKKYYEILKKTFEFDIHGCGISGAGGEDAVWCILDECEEVEKYWRREFDCVIVTEIIENGLEIYE